MEVLDKTLEKIKNIQTEQQQYEKIIEELIASYIPQFYNYNEHYQFALNISLLRKIDSKN